MPAVVSPAISIGAASVFVTEGAADMPRHIQGMEFGLGQKNPPMRESSGVSAEIPASSVLNAENIWASFCLAVGFVYGCWLFWPIIPTDLGLLPTTLSQDTFHLADWIGRVAFLAVTCALAERFVPRNDRWVRGN